MKENKITNQLKDKAIWLVLVILVIAFTIANERFINPNNILTLLRQVSMYGIASIGMTFVILLGDIDLSTGTVISFVNILCAHIISAIPINAVCVAYVAMIAGIPTVATMKPFNTPIKVEATSEIRKQWKKRRQKPSNEIGRAHV